MNDYIPKGTEITVGGLTLRAMYTAHERAMETKQAREAEHERLSVAADEAFARWLLEPSLPTAKIHRLPEQENTRIEERRTT